MKLLVFIFNKVEHVEPLLEQFQSHDIHGATILDSTGMARALSHYEDENFLTSLRTLLDPSRQQSKTLLTVLKADQVNIAIECIEKVVGDIDLPDNGIVFTLPVDFVKGIQF